MSLYSDKELLKLYEDNNVVGFKIIVKQFQERVYWQIRRLTKNHQDTEDVMQNVFIKVWKGLPKFKKNSALYTWIYRITFNETHTFLTNNQKRKNINLDPPIFENLPTEQSHFFSTTEKEISGAEIEQILFKAISTLPEKQQQVFRLRYLDEMKFKDIAIFLNLSEGGVKSNYHHAVKKIEDLIRQY
ncbi:MAG TPA: sigma-70 family RNA polymerase sigma factor [Crocinitomix sp.]|nr:sigma-70 family RNA polymerase sigma factor [Crocinitomix sp.]